MLKQLLTTRRLNLIIALAALGLGVLSFYFQYVVGLQPCPLCLLQRYALFAIGLVLLVAAWHNPGRKGLRAYMLLSLLFTFGGAAAAGRQLWLQHQPLSADNACVPGLDYLFHTLSASQALGVIVSSPGQCAEVTWQFLGISMAGWSLISFIVLALLIILAGVFAGRSSN